MDFIHIKSLEKYHPGYKDRTLQWAKIYFNMVQGDPKFELIESEVDKWRYISMVCLELRAQEPLPNVDRYWQSKGFDLRKRSMSLTLQVLHNFINVVTVDSKQPHVDKDKDKDKEEYRTDKDKESVRVTKFIKPTKEQIEAYCKEKGYTTIDVDYWLNHYNSNGWKVGKNPMVNWKATISNWERRNLKDKPIDKPQKRINHYVYKCPSCNKEYHPRLMKGEDDFDAYRCDENDCQKVGLGKDGKNMVGYQLEFIKRVDQE